jgi:hypothetical protein
VGALGAAVVVRVENLDDVAAPGFVASHQASARQHAAIQRDAQAGTPAEERSQFSMDNEAHPLLHAPAGG